MAAEAPAVVVAALSGGAPGDQGMQQVLDRMVKANETLVAQNKAILDLLAGIHQSSKQQQQQQQYLKPPSQVEHESRASEIVETYGSWYRRSQDSSTSKQPHTDSNNDRIWDDILSRCAEDQTEYLRHFNDFDRPPTINALLKENQPWTTWAYEAAFPNLSRFLTRSQKLDRCRSQVYVDDFDTEHGARCSLSFWEPPKRRRKNATRPILKPSDQIPFNEAVMPADKLWDALRVRPASGEYCLETRQLENHSHTHATMGLVRTFRIVDLSPMVVNCLLGAASRLDVSHVSGFIERHLARSNWGKTSLIKPPGMTWSSYTFEYHFSFFYVTPEYSDTGVTKHDPRQWRKSAPFGREVAAQTRYIHEESLSFLLVGHLDSIGTCIQLAESYYRPPYQKAAKAHNFRQYVPEQSPVLLFLNWISVSLHHARWRWQSAIEAINSEIKSPAEILFMTEGRDDLMSDDPQFSLSKTYFWALQAYKLFEQVITDTITTWKRFEETSLPALRDGRIDEDSWATHVGDINDAIADLQKKIEDIKEKMTEVKDLRRGLVATATLFDSRTTVRQGENIRLLTYVTILFLPLSFVTSIFGMQFLEGGPITTRAFAITVPLITLVTALAIFNLQNILDSFHAMAGNMTSGLRHLMLHHRRKDWKSRAIALHEDMATQAPVRKATRQSSGWVYSLFLAEYLTITLPVNETLAGLTFLSSIRNAFRRTPDDFHRLRTPNKEAQAQAQALGHRRLNTVQLESNPPTVPFSKTEASAGTSGDRAANTATLNTSMSLAPPLPPHQQQQLSEKSTGAATICATQTHSRAEEVRNRVEKKINESIEQERRRERAAKEAARGPLLNFLVRCGKGVAAGGRGFAGFLRTLLLPLWIGLLLWEFVILSSLFSMSKSGNADDDECGPLLASASRGASGGRNQSGGAHKASGAKGRAWEILGLQALAGGFPFRLLAPRCQPPPGLVPLSDSNLDRMVKFRREATMQL